MRLILHSPYLCIEYLLWRSFNFKDQYSLYLQNNLEKLKVSLENTKSRNLSSTLYFNETPITYLKQYGGSEDSSFIGNENVVIEHLINEKFDNIPTIVLFDEDYMILGTEYLSNHKPLDKYFEYFKTKGEWQQINDIALSLSKVVKSLHSLSVLSDSLKLNFDTFFKISKEQKRQEELIKILSEVKEDWDKSCLIHFDLRLNNIMFDKSTKNIKIIDWEMACNGHALWDISTIIVSLCTALGGVSFFYTQTLVSNFEQIKNTISIFLNSYYDGSVIPHNISTIKKLMLIQYRNSYDGLNLSTFDKILELSYENS